MGLLNSWRESLTILSPRNLKPTVTIWWQAWKAAWIYLLGILCADSLIMNGYFNFYRGIKTDFVIFGVPAFIALFLVAARPSTEQKNAAYFFRMAYSYALQLIVFLIAWRYLWWSGRLTVWVSEIDAAVLTWALLFFWMFLLDSSPWNPMLYVKAARNFLVFFVYNIPLVILGNALIIVFAGFFFALLLFGDYSSVDPLRALTEHTPVLAEFLGLLIIVALVPPWYVAFWVNVYIKRVRDNPNLYV